MSAHTDAYVRCDGKVPSDLTKSGRAQCPAKVEGGYRPDGTSLVWPHTKAEARREALRRGWAVRRRHDGSPDSRGLFDFCPDHKPNLGGGS